MPQLVESLRLTAFLGATPSPREPTWWSDLTDNEPETRTSKPPMGVFQEIGVFQDRTLVLSIQPGRIDWLFNPGPSQVEAEISSVGDIPSAQGIFLPAMRRWLGEMAPAVIRMGYGVTLLEPVRDKVAGYMRLAELLPAVHIDPQGSADFIYQINRPRQSALGIQNLSINRLSNWSVALIQRFGFIFSAGSPPALAPPQLGALSAVRIALDISTAPTFPGELPHGRLADIFDELINLGAEIAAHGDRA
jgi:hypothetical protein